MKQITDYGLDIIIAENLRNADEFFRLKLKKLLPKYYPIDKLVGLIETSIGKMVPIMQKEDIREDILQIFAEPYNTLILSGKGFKNPLPAINGLAPKKNIKAWVDRKLFIHNLGHSAAAYIGFIFNPGFNFIYEALAVPEVYNLVRETMLQASNLLSVKYKDEFTLKELTRHVDDLLVRFQNKALEDTIFRAGCDLSRKLGTEDRLVGAIKLAVDLRLPYDKILYTLVCACYFRAKDQNGNMLNKDVEFAHLFEKGINSILKSTCGLDGILYKQVRHEAKKIDDVLKIAKTSSFQK